MKNRFFLRASLFAMMLGSSSLSSMAMDPNSDNNSPLANRSVQSTGWESSLSQFKDPSLLDSITSALLSKFSNFLEDKNVSLFLSGLPQRGNKDPKKGMVIEGKTFDPDLRNLQNNGQVFVKTEHARELLTLNDVYVDEKGGFIYLAGQFKTRKIENHTFGNFAHGVVIKQAFPIDLYQEEAFKKDLLNQILLSYGMDLTSGIDKALKKLVEGRSFSTVQWILTDPFFAKDTKEIAQAETFKIIAPSLLPNIIERKDFDGLTKTISVLMQEKSLENKLLKNIFNAILESKDPDALGWLF